MGVSKRGRGREDVVCRNSAYKVIVVFGKSLNHLRDSISPLLQNIIIPDLGGFDLKTLQVTQLYWQ